MKKIKPIITEMEGDAWSFFGLSYASWLVLPRIALQSMPLKWQVRFFKMVNEIEDTLEMPKVEGYVVSVKKNNKFIRSPFPHYKHNYLPNKTIKNER